MKLGAATLCVLFLGAAYYLFFYPPTLLKRETINAIESFNTIMEKKEPASVTKALQEVLAEEAQIRLEVTMFQISGGNDARAIIHAYDKPAFIAFIGDTLKRMQDFGHYGKAGDFALASGYATASATLSSKEWADGESLIAGAAVMMRYSADTRCDLSLRFADGKPLLTEVRCALRMRMLPKPGEGNKLQSPEAFRQLLMR